MKQPPLLMDEFSKNFIGIRVNWIGSFSNISDIGNDMVQITVYPDDWAFYFKASLKDYPIFKTLKTETARIHVTGTIESASSGIDLVDTKIISIQPIEKE